MGDEPGDIQVLQQYSKQLNIYSPDNSSRARFKINYADMLEVSYATGLKPVLIKNLFFQDGDYNPPKNLAAELYMGNVLIQEENMRAIAIARPCPSRC
jgi:hypothetical protein